MTPGAINVRELLLSQTFWTALAALAASASAFAAAVYTALTYRLVETQGDGNVVVYVRHDESRATILQIVVENVGFGLASEIRFRSSRPIPGQAWGLDEKEVPEPKPMTQGPLINGIPNLGHRDSRKISWGQYAGLKKALGTDPIILSYDYVTNGRRVAERTAQLEVSSFESTDAVDSEGARIIKELRKISDNLGRTADAVASAARASSQRR